MILFPAVDIKGGRCVRLSGGDYNQETVYFDDPLQAAEQWVGLGAEWLHLVDLDGALEGRRVNSPIVKKIIQGVKIPVQIGGGIRNEEALTSYVTMGAARVLFGTQALQDPAFVKQSCRRYPEKIGVSLDCKNGKVAIKGWTETTQKKGIDIAHDLEQWGVACIIYTDTTRDGRLGGIDRRSVTEFIREVRLPVIIAGGVSSLDDIRACREAGAYGAILGKALYEKKVELPQALKEASLKAGSPCS